MIDSFTISDEKFINDKVKNNSIDNYDNDSNNIKLFSDLNLNFCDSFEFLKKIFFITKRSR